MLPGKYEETPFLPTRLDVERVEMEAEIERLQAQLDAQKPLVDAAIEVQLKAVQDSLQIAYAALRAVLPDRKHGCLCDQCLRDIIQAAAESAEEE